MSRFAPNAQYLKTAVETATPTRRLLMLYDGAIRFLGQALPAMRARDYEAQSRFIGKAQDIIVYLRATLDFEAGGAVARQLEAVYTPMYDMLTDANIHDRPEKIEKVIEFLRELREAWVEVDRQCQMGKSAGRDPGAKSELVAA
ncbi:MAG: flagellar export chaperone FliS [Armatimonadetes bacterium]|nr:flagellar export chaperone FliS [Armatimonadota bacterium]